MNTRLGLSAKTPSTDPHVHFSWPGNWLSGLGQSFTTSYGPVRSQPPVSPGTAANPAPGRACPRTSHRFARKNPISTPKAIVKSVRPALRIVFLRAYLREKCSFWESRAQFTPCGFGVNPTLTPIPAAHLVALNLIALNLI